METLCQSRRTALTISLFLSFIFLQSSVEGIFRRKLNATLNPGCKAYDACNSSINILYVGAIGQSDVLHYLLSTLGGIPSTLIVNTSLNDQLRINWTLLQNNSADAISFNKAQFSYGLILKQVLQFDDKNDTGYLNDSNTRMPLNLTSLSWTNITYSQSSDMITASFITNKGTYDFSVNGSFTIKASISGISKYDDDFPHLKYTANSTQLNFIFDKMEPYFNSTRLALEFIAMSYPATIEWKEEKTRSIDDEYTPGVFTSYEMTLSGNKAFLFWKPLVYTSPEHTVIDSTDVVMYGINNATNTPFCIASAYFNDSTTHKTFWTVSFGSSKDGFYTKTNYSVWSLMTGLGSPPPDEISEVAVIFMAIGLGAPTLLILSGATYLGWKRLRRKDDDLLLSRYSIQ